MGLSLAQNGSSEQSNKAAKPPDGISCYERLTAGKYREDVIVSNCCKLMPVISKPNPFKANAWGEGAMYVFRYVSEHRKQREIYMLVYTLLFLASLAVSLLCLWLYNLTVLARKKMQRAKKQRKQAAQMSPVSGNTQVRNMRMTYSSTLQDVATNRPQMTTWTGSIQSRDEYRPREDDSQGSTLSAYLARKDLEKRSSSDWRQNISQSIRDDRSYLTEPTSPSDSTGLTGNAKGPNAQKPWGW